MNNIVNTISVSVLSNDMSSIPLTKLQQLAETHPYAAAFQLLYAQKLKEENKEAFAHQWQKTMLCFNNPLFVHHAVNTDVVKDEPEEVEETGEEQAEEDSKVINIPGLKIEPIDPFKNALSFTPYHTVDYFASQGIKLGEEIKSADRFGNQLKSFTSWLKEMRRLPEAEVTSKFNSFDNTNVEKMAQSSLSGENAITEAMAQVWIKQHNPQKAIDIYKKLSLQNPAKSAFFAAKIEHLKKQL